MSHENDTLKFGGPGDAIVMACPPDVNPDDDSVRHYGGLLVCESASAEWRRRIVACVNACAGIPTGQLESVSGKLAISSSVSMWQSYCDKKMQLEDAIEQRDEVLVAIEGVAASLRKAGACIPAPENKGTIESAMATGLSIALVLVEDAVASAKDQFRGATEMMKGGADAPADIDDGFVGRIDDAITEALGDAMDCTRVWAAWGYGTMGQDDFVRVADDPGRVMEIRDAVLRVVRATEKGGAA